MAISFALFSPQEGELFCFFFFKIYFFVRDTSNLSCFLVQTENIVNSSQLRQLILIDS
jgi:hypothetical protein